MGCTITPPVVAARRRCHHSQRGPQEGDPRRRCGAGPRPRLGSGRLGP
ncbi:hypothetical protein CyaNS01_01910 [Cyanobium sp. NS01]|nr:hypothetical protein CyaNS01_01910 [Cyanobium sp. NS01]